MDNKSRNFIEFKPGGIAAAGDLSKIPPGRTPDCLNVVLRPGPRLEARPGFKNSTPATGRDFWTLARYVDNVGGTEKLFAFAFDSMGSHIWVTEDGTTWTAPTDPVLLSLTTFDYFPSSAFIRDFASVRNLLYLVIGSTDGPQDFNDPVDNATRSHVAAINGDGVTFSYPFGQQYELIQPRAVCGFLERLFLNNIGQVVTPRFTGVDVSVSYGWTLNSVTKNTYVASFPNGTSTTTYLVPGGSSGTRYVWYQTPSVMSASSQVALNPGAGVSGTIRFEGRNRSATTALPLTVKLIVGSQMARNQAYSLGTVMRPTTVNNYRYRCTTGGTTAGAEPVWGTTLGGTTVDGTVTWTCDGPDTLSKIEINLPPNTDGAWYTYYVNGTVPEAATCNLSAEIRFGNSAYTSWPTDGFDSSFVTDFPADDQRSEVKCTALVEGLYNFPPGSNADASYSVPEKEIVGWTEFQRFAGTDRILPVRASNFTRLIEIPGPGTALTSLAGRLFAFKSNATYVFSGSADPNLPINLERVIAQYGCLGPRAHATFEDRIYTIGETDVLAFSPSGDVERITDDSVREMMFARGQWWVPTLDTYNRPILAIDPVDRLMYVYTQIATIFVYSFDSKAWTKFEIAKDVNGYADQVVDIMWALNRMWISTVLNKLGYLDASTLRDETSDGVTSYPIRYYYDLPVTEMSPSRADLLIESVDVHHQITESAPSIKVEISRDGGETFPQSNTVNLTQSPSTSVTKVDRIDIWQTSDSLRVRLGDTGDCGDGVFRVTGFTLAVQRLSDDDNMEYPVSSTSSNL